MTDLLEDTVTLVYVTGAGDAYHSSQDCRDLKAGQQSGEAQGHEVRPIDPVELNDDVRNRWTACGTCGGTP